GRVGRPVALLPRVSAFHRRRRKRGSSGPVTSDRLTVWRVRLALAHSRPPTASRSGSERVIPAVERTAPWGWEGCLGRQGHPTAGPAALPESGRFPESGGFVAKCPSS